MVLIETMDDCIPSKAIAEARKICELFKSDDKRIRKQAVIDFYILLEDEHSSDDLHNIFKECHIFILNVLRDKVESVREQAIKLIRFYIIDVLPLNDYYLSYLIPVLVERIGNVEIIEESEELRLQLVLLLHSVINKYNKDNQLKSFLNDLITILKEIVLDKYPAIKENSCKCIVSLAKALPKHFHMQAENLVKPVLTALSHQRFKIRVEAIKCIEEVILHSSYKSLEEVIGPLAERLFDQISTVRKAIIQVTARWLLEYRDRYSAFYKLIPLILTGLNDDIEEIRDESYQLWSKVGLQYEKENEKDLKEQMDYLTKIPKFYPENLSRPNLGCRVLVQSNISKISNALSRELVSWQPDVRFRCSQLLCSFAHHAEEGLTQHLQDLLLAMYSSARDEDERVVVNISRAGELMGLFVPVNSWMKLIFPAIEDCPHSGHLLVLSAFIRGTPQEFIAPILQKISHQLADQSICFNRKMEYQKQLIKCVDAIQAKYTTNLSPDIGQNLFNIIITISSLNYQTNSDLINNLIDNLTASLKFESNNALWSKYTRNLLLSIQSDPLSWTEVMFERCIFEYVLINSKDAFGENLDTIGEILIKALNTEVDAESRLRTFFALSSALEKKDIIFKNSSYDSLQVFLEKLITEIFVPSLVWKAGRTSEAMRTVAVSCLCSAFRPGQEVELFKESTILKTLFNKLLPLLISLMEDASYKSRMFSIEAIIILKYNLVNKSIWNNEDLIKIYPEVLKRLDDPTDKVRLVAIKAIKRLLENSPAEFKLVTYKAHHEFLLDTLLTHFDDDENNFKNYVLGALLNMVDINASLLKEKVIAHKKLIKNEEGCEKIIEKLIELEI